MAATPSRLHKGHGTREVVADHVVLALPFTTLRDVELSHAGIPALHRLAIRTEPLGSNAKMFLQFTRRVWDQADETGNAYCAGVVQGAWDASGYQAGSQGHPRRAARRHDRHRLGSALQPASLSRQRAGDDGE